MNTLLERLFVLLNIYWFVVLCFVIINSVVETTTFSIKTKTKQIVNHFIPQGWGFFTKNPKEEDRIFIYKNIGGEYILTFNPNSSLKNVLGFKRKERAKQRDVMFIMNELTDDDFVLCRSLDKTWCEQNKVRKLKSKFTFYDKGEYFLVLQKPTPWAWAKHSETLLKPTRSTKIIIE